MGRAHPSGAGPAESDLPGDPEQPPGDPETVARIVCLRLLERRARTRAELADALRKRGVPDDAAGTVLDRFTEVGLVDDAALAESMAGAQHRERGLARRAVAAKLRRRGVPDEHIDAALTQIDPDSERERARHLVRARQRALAGLPVPVQHRRLVGLLARKGYPPGVAHDAVRSVLRDAGAGGGADDDGDSESLPDTSPDFEADTG